MTNADVLNSWKEIATYVGRGVRTVQRWEQELHLPVRRPRGKQRSAVIAIKEDLDLWLRTPHGRQAQGDKHATHQQNHERLMHNAQLLITRTTVLLARSDALQKEITRSISIGAALANILRSRKNSAEELGWHSTGSPRRDHRAMKLATRIAGGGRINLMMHPRAN